MVRMERICVRRLKSFMDYSNVAVELCASLDGEDLEQAYDDLIVKANVLIERTRLIEQSEELVKAIEAERRSLQEQLLYLENLLRKIEEQKRELRDAISEAEDMLSKSMSIRNRLALILKKGVK